MKTVIKFLFLTFLVAVGGFTFGSEAIHYITHLSDPANVLLPAVALVPIAVVDATRQRWAYERLAPLVSMINQMTNRGIIMNEDSFRSEQLITNNNGNIQFETYDKIMQTTINDWPLQKGVKDNDIFYGVGYRVFIDHRLSGATAVNPQTYPNPKVFITGTNTGSSTDLFSIFNAVFSFQVGRTVFIPGKSVLECLLVPQTQQSLADNFSQFNGASMLPLDPYPVFSGRSDNKLQLTVKLPTGWAGAATAGQNVVTFEMVGYTLQNAESFLPFLNGEQDLKAIYDKWIAMSGDDRRSFKLVS